MKFVPNIVKQFNPRKPLAIVTATGTRMRQNVLNNNVFVKKINEAWAISLKIDGSIDFTQKDKIYGMAKIVNLDRTVELLFIGIAKQKERIALGILEMGILGILQWKR